VPRRGADCWPRSTPAYQSPLRHHRRAASSTRRVKETLNARSEYSNSEDDGTAQHRINQYLIKQEIGRGSFGAVHLAVDQYGHEYAVKEFSKSRLRKRAQSNLLRRPAARRRALPAGIGFNSPLHRHAQSSVEEVTAFELIKEEIAIMKKLNHPNLVTLIEVLDDPEEDSLYMVMEMCKKGVVMQVGLDERADPYSEEKSRCWLRDMILGLEYRMSVLPHLQSPSNTASPCPRHHPPRHQARQLPHHRRRRAQDCRLWRFGNVRQGRRDEDCKVGWLSCVHAPRVVCRKARPRLGSCCRHLVHGLHAVLPDLRPDPLREARHD
jgi:hypothetical protein